MKRAFNTTGPCNPQDHYMVPAQSRLSNLKDFVDAKQYFVIHAARQTGKTTLLQDLVQELNAEGDYYALYCDLQALEGVTAAEQGVPAIAHTMALDLSLHPTLARFPFAEDVALKDFSSLLRGSLSRLCAALDKPLVIMFDEVDCLSDATLISFLRQLRSGYVSRVQVPFVHSLALVGVRNIRDYKARVRDDQETLRTQSPFIISAESLTLRNFNAGEVTELLSQHTQDTGQAFPKPVAGAVHAATQGQPWLVNAIAREIVIKLLQGDHTREVLPEHVGQAVENIILRRETHIDSLLAKLHDERVRPVIETVLTGDRERFSSLDDDVQYVLDLGLVERRDRALQPANPIYAEVIVRTLNIDSQNEIAQQGGPVGTSKYLVGEGLDVTTILTDFQSFWRQHSEIWQERYQYQEAAPHLILMAFLQNVLNGEGRSLREYASGRGRVDLCLEVLGRRYPIELKIRYGDKTTEEGCEQLAGYLERMGCEEGWLVIFDRRPDISWDEKTYHRTVAVGSRTLHVLGC